MQGYIERISSLVGDPDRKIFSVNNISNAYDAASSRYASEENRCYSAAVELLTTDIPRLMSEYSIKRDGDGVEATETQALADVISARKMLINELKSNITIDINNSRSKSGFGFRVATTTIRGIND